MSARSADLRARGVDLVFVGNGAPRYARAFAEEQHLHVPLYTDPELHAYRALSFKHGLGRTLGTVRTFGHAFRALSKGYRQGATQGEPFQQGGVVVVTPQGDVPYLFASEEAGDHPDADAILEAVTRAGCP